MSSPEVKTPVLEIDGLKQHFPITKGLLGRNAGYVYAVDAEAGQAPTPPVRRQDSQGCNQGYRNRGDGR